MRVLDLFSGIGGFSIGLERAGMETVAFCEIEEYPRRVLAKHWPDVPIYEDVRELNRDRLDQDGITVDVICGGFPCQDISLAGQQAGIGEGTRSGLWSECARLLRELRPRYAIFENVTALLSGGNGEWFQQVLWDISQVGYDAEWHCIPASELGAHHHRDRVWIVCYPNTHSDSLRDTEIPSREAQAITGDNGQTKPVAHADSQRGRRRPPHRENAGNAGEPSWHPWIDTRGMGTWNTEPDVGRVANGVPNRAHRLKCLGNAVVPQIPEILGRAIMQAECST